MKKSILISFLVLAFIKTNAQNDAVTKSGDVLLVMMPAAALGSTFIWKDDNTKPTWQFLKAYGSAMALTQVLKYTVQKTRPDGSDTYSFPSGHTSSSFTSAAFIQRRYGWNYGIPAYLLASYVGYTRIQANKHDGWDVLAGAAIGIGAGYIFTKPYKKPNVEVSFGKIKSEYTINLRYQF